MPKKKQQRSNTICTSFTAGGLGKCRGPLALVVSNAIELRRRGYSSYIRVGTSEQLPAITFELNSDMTVTAVQIPWHLAPENVEAHAKSITELIHLREECA